MSSIRDKAKNFKSKQKKVSFIIAQNELPDDEELDSTTMSNWIRKMIRNRGKFINDPKIIKSLAEAMNSIRATHPAALKKIQVELRKTFNDEMMKRFMEVTK